VLTTTMHGAVCRTVAEMDTVPVGTRWDAKELISPLAKYLLLFGNCDLIKRLLPAFLLPFRCSTGDLRSGALGLSESLSRLLERKLRLVLTSLPCLHRFQ
jgi:hypothetical protein